jgi:hypothetical protein
VSNIETIVSIASGVLVPIAILVIGHWFTSQREKADEAQRNADRVALLLNHLTSDKTQERLLALQVLGYLRRHEEFPSELADTVTVTTFRDNPEVAGAALLVFGGLDHIPDEVVLLELLAPLKIQLDRTREAFKNWKVRDANTERVIKQSNEYARDLLVSKAYLIPEELRNEAGKLVEHYNAWLAEYAAVYKDGLRDPEKPYVFVGTKGFPFPV